MRTRDRFAVSAVSALLLFTSPALARADEAAPVEEVIQARAQIDATIDQMRALATRVRDELRVARRRGTRRQITCADQSLSRVDVAVRRARETSDEVLSAYAKNDLEAARAARSRLVEIREFQRDAANAGAQCTPPIIVAATGVTTVKLQIDPKVPPAP